LFKIAQKLNKCQYKMTARFDALIVLMENSGGHRWIPKNSGSFSGNVDLT
jgi:hypothetical protein